MIKKILLFPWRMVTWPFRMLAKPFTNLNKLPKKPSKNDYQKEFMEGKVHILTDSRDYENLEQFRTTIQVVPILKERLENIEQSWHKHKNTTNNLKKKEN